MKDTTDEKGFLVQDDILYTYGPIDFFTALDQALQSIAQCGLKEVSTLQFLYQFSQQKANGASCIRN